MLLIEARTTRGCTGTGAHQIRHLHYRGSTCGQNLVTGRLGLPLLIRVWPCTVTYLQSDDAASGLLGGSCGAYRLQACAPWPLHARSRRLSCTENGRSRSAAASSSKRWHFLKAASAGRAVQRYTSGLSSASAVVLTWEKMLDVLHGVRQVDIRSQRERCLISDRATPKVPLRLYCIRHAFSANLGEVDPAASLPESLSTATSIPLVDHNRRLSLHRPMSTCRREDTMEIAA